MSTCNTCSTPFPSVPIAPAFPAFPPPAPSTSTPSSSSGGSTTTPATCPDYLNAPKLAQTVTMPAVNATGQLFSQCAYLWAVPGAVIFLPPFGLINIAGVSGDLITFQNINIPAGQVIQAQTILIQGAPQALSASALVTQLDRLRGFLNTADSYLVGTPGQVMRWNKSGLNTFLQPTDGMLFFPNTSGYNVEISPKDVGGSAITTTPIPSAGTGLSAYYDLPNLPAADLLPATFWVKVHLRLSVAAIDTTSANAFRADHNAVELARMTYQFEEHHELLLPSTSNKLKIDYTKLNAKTNCFARLRVLGYFF
jgi:hypothetical protein